MNLPKGNTELSRDPRSIQTILWAPGPHPRRLSVGEDSITRIEAYDESGSMSHVPWLAVFREGEIFARVPADQVSVVYADAERA